MEIQSIILSAAVTMISLGLLIVSLVSYKKHTNPKLLFISFVFVVFLLKGLLVSIDLLYTELSTLHNFLYSSNAVVFDLIILLMLFTATLKR